MICIKCGRNTDRSYRGMCQSCHNYFKNGGTINPLPDAGKIEYDENGRVICHICGRAFNRLGSHVKGSHNMTIAEYKTEFRLCSRARTTEMNYSAMMSAYAYKNGADSRIAEAGKNTRVKPGETYRRKDKKARLQEVLNKRSRGKKDITK